MTTNDDDHLGWEQDVEDLDEETQALLPHGGFAEGGLRITRVIRPAGPRYMPWQYLTEPIITEEEQP